MLRFTRFFAKRLFKEYNKHINRSIDAVAHLPKNIPMLLVCAKDDAIVPCESTMMLYEATLVNKHKRDNVCLYCIETGAHANICHSKENGDEYVQVVHAFYKECGLPHGANLAANGAQRFAKC